MSSSQILQEYLIKLGYSVDTGSLRRFEDGLGKTNKTILKVGKGVTALVVATAVASAEFAYHMRRMYFASELAGSSVGNLRAIGFASKQAGIDAGSMENALKNISQNMMFQPGFESWVNSMGIQTAGRETSDILKDIGIELKKMQPWLGVQFARDWLHMDNDTFQMWMSHMDEINANTEKAIAIDKRFGLNFKENDDLIKSYTGTLDALWHKFEDLGYVVLNNASVFRIFEDAASGTGLVLGHIADMVNGVKGADFKSFVNKGARIIEGQIGLKPGTISSTAGIIQEDFKSGSQDLINGSQDLIKRIIRKESNFNPNAYNKKSGASGLMQLVPATAKMLGVRNPFDPEQNVKGGTSYINQLLKKYGNEGIALGAYNWGPGNMDAYLKTGKGKKGQAMPPETVDYMESITGQKLGTIMGQQASLTQNMTFNITGENPEDTQKAAVKHWDSATKSVQRNLGGVGVPR